MSIRIVVAGGRGNTPRLSKAVRLRPSLCFFPRSSANLDAAMAADSVAKVSETRHPSSAAGGALREALGAPPGRRSLWAGRSHV